MSYIGSKRRMMEGDFTIHGTKMPPRLAKWFFTFLLENRISFSSHTSDGYWSFRSKKTPRPKDPDCNKCEFEDSGWCHRAPPPFPYVGGGKKWCGEFVPKDDVEEAA